MITVLNFILFHGLFVLFIMLIKQLNGIFYLKEFQEFAEEKHNKEHLDAIHWNNGGSDILGELSSDSLMQSLIHLES